ncbi:MAG TPA: hypothetical protein VHB98_09700, partial [Chloroflexota bacterium]|nr:hypothetical protein [Chloroflexota bacterium]
ALAAAAITGTMISFTVVSDSTLLGLPLALAPGLLCALPLLNPGLQRAIQQRPELANHRRRAAQALLRAYVFLVVLRAPFAPWLPPLIAILLVARFLMESYRETGAMRLDQGAHQLAP